MMRKNFTLAVGLTALLYVSVQAQDRLQFNLLSQLNLCWSAVDKVTIQGDHAYVLVEYLGMHIVNIANPLQPFEEGYYIPKEDVKDFAISGNFAYVAAGNNVQVVDISNPSNPVLVGQCQLTGLYIHSIAVLGDYVYAGLRDFGYVTGYLRVVNVANPAHPVPMGVLRLGSEVYDIVAVGQYAYLANTAYGLYIVDISNPMSPSIAGIYNTASEALDVAVSGNFAYVADEYDGLIIVNVSDPTQPTLAGSLDTPGILEGLAMQGDYVYLADYTSAVRMVNVADPYHPYETGSCSVPSGHCKKIDVAGDYAYAAGMEYGLRVLNVADPTNPFAATFFDRPGGLTDVAAQGDYAYLTNSADALHLINVSDPTAPHEESLCPLNAEGICVTVREDYAYVGMDFPTGGFSVVNVSEPTNPYVESDLTSMGSVRGIALQDDYAFLASSDGLCIVNVSTPSNPQVVGSCGTSGFPWDVAVQGDYAYLAVNSGLSVVEVTNLTSPHEVGYIELHDKGDVMAVGVSGDYAYAGACNLGLYVLDVSNPQIPMMVGHVGYWVDNITMWEDYVLSGTYLYGLIAVNVSNPTHPWIEVQQPPGGVDKVAQSGDYVYTIRVGEFLAVSEIIPTEARAVPAMQPSPPSANLSVSPNPFNPTTVARYELRVASHVRVQVYDTAGKLVATLVDGWREAGDHQVTFDGSGLPSGIYFAKISANQSSQIQKLVLLK